MNGSKTIVNCRKVGGDYFGLASLRSSNLYLKDFIDRFNFDDYWCFKTTDKQRLVSYLEFLEFGNSRYTFFRKDLYNIDWIIEWIDWFKNLGGVKFLSCPTPPFPPQKIIIRK